MTQRASEVRIRQLVPTFLVLALAGCQSQSTPEHLNEEAWQRLLACADLKSELHESFASQCESLCRADRRENCMALCKDDAEVASRYEYFECYVDRRNSVDFRE